MSSQQRIIKFLYREEIDRLVKSIREPKTTDLAFAHAGAGIIGGYNYKKYNKRMLEAKRDKAIIEILFSTGARLSELLRLKRKDLTVSPNKTKEIVLIGKGGWQRTVYISPRAIRAYLRYEAGRADNTDKAFRLSPRSVQLMVKGRAEAAGLRNIHPHVFRHSLACDLLSRGVDIRVIQSFLGHKDIRNTVIYTQVTSKNLHDVHSKLYK